MSEELTASKPGQIRRATTLVALPILQDGERIVVRHRALGRIEILDILEGIPGVDGGVQAAAVQTVAQARDLLVKSESHVRRLIEAAVIEPAFAFDGPDPDRASWNDLLPDNQGALTKSIMDFSGWKGADAPEAVAFRPGGAGQ